MSFISTWLVTAIATAIAIAVVPGITAVGGSYLGPIMCALMLALVNATVKPLAEVLSLPLSVLTLGLFHLVINALMLELAGKLSTGIFGSGISIASFGAAFAGAIIVSLASMVVSNIVG